MVTIDDERTGNLLLGVGVAAMPEDRLLCVGVVVVPEDRLLGVELTAPGGFWEALKVIKSARMYTSRIFLGCWGVPCRKRGSMEGFLPPPASEIEQGGVDPTIACNGAGIKYRGDGSTNFGV
jgi:hypothetical protein